MKRTASSSLAFVLFLLGTGTVILRPGELWPLLKNVPIYEVLVLSGFVLSFGRIRKRCTIRALRKDPVTACVIGVFVAVVLSHLSHFYLSGAEQSGILFLKTLVYYAVLVTVIDTPLRLRRLLLTVAACGSVMVTLGVVDYSGWLDVKLIEHVRDHDGTTDTGEEQRIIRMTGTGIFHDPNDLSQFIIATAVLCSYFATDRSLGSRRFGWVLPIIVLAGGLIFTQSRGGLAAAAAALMTLMGMQYGRKVSLGIAVLGLCLLPWFTGRQSDFSIEDGTGQERIQLWLEGFTALQSPELLFGIGQGFYSDVAGLVAHNSFVHAYVELGVFGGTLFFGCFFFAAAGLVRMRRMRTTELPPELWRFRPYLAAILAGWCAAMLSISRCYVVPTYLVTGMATSYLMLAGACANPRRLLICWDRTQAVRLLTGSAALFVSLFLLARTLAT